MGRAEDEALIEAMAGRAVARAALVRLVARLLPTTTYSDDFDLELRPASAVYAARRLLLSHGRLIDDPARLHDVSGLVVGGALDIGPVALRVRCTPAGGAACRVRIDAWARDTRLNWPSARRAVRWLRDRLESIPARRGRDRPGCTGSDGDCVLDPEVGQVAELLERGADYWEGQSGAAWLGWFTPRAAPDGGWRERHDLPCLHLMVRPDLGVLALHSDGDIGQGHEGSLLAIDPSIPQGVVSYCVGGEPMGLPRQSFLPRDLALLAIADFLAAGGRSNQVRWRQVRQTADGGLEYA